MKKRKYKHPLYAKEKSNILSSKKHKPTDPNGANIYDRILRENAKEIFLPLIQEFLDLDIKSAEPITEKFTKTIEKETDFLYKAVTNSGEKIILHIEFQSSNDKEMLYRMAEYHGLIFRKFKTPVRHIVVYLGKAKVNMPTKLVAKEVFSAYDLISINELDANIFLSSQIPELILFAFLGKYKKEKTELILQQIVAKLKEKANSENELKKYAAQLILLARLRKLEKQTINILEDMPITIDIENDFLYKKGRNEGREQGRNEGREQGRNEGREEGRKEGREEEREIYHKKTVNSVLELFKLGLSTQNIANALSLSLEKVERILRENR